MKKQSTFPCLIQVFNDQISALRNKQKTFTADNYRNVMRSVTNFLGNSAERFSVSGITSTWLHTYIIYLNESGRLAPGSVVCYCHILSAVYNKAVREYAIPVTTRSPFEDIHITVPPTLKRALSEDELQKVIDSDLSLRKKLSPARDLFLFLFYAHGMCFVDAYNLRYDQISGGHIQYRRSKTASPIQVNIVREMQDIMDRYREEGSPYVFPFLRVNQYTGEKISEKSSLRRINRQLASLGEMLGLKLTTYVARHTWASLMEQCGASLSIISQGMGHRSQRVTMIYLRGLPSHMVDKANESMLDQFVRRKSKVEEKKCPIFCKNETSFVVHFTSLCYSKTILLQMYWL